ncbi:hypothetical protein [Ekhidna sp.]|uniref:hypothetical protein n=1 Tax=Ekhidna sp. TaxID=2608089 RepID=UPI003CCBA100
MNWKAVILIGCSLFFSCGEDDSCGEKGNANGECLDVSIDYDVFDLSGSRATPTTSEYMLVTYQFGPGSPRFSFALWANQYDDEILDEEGENYLFERNKGYNAATMTFNGDFNTTGKVTTIFSKIDRENGLVSGSFTWAQDENDFVDADSFSGTFTDVEVSFE